MSHTESILHCLETFRYKCPIPFLWSLNDERTEIHIKVGRHKTFLLPITEDIAPTDYVSMLENMIESSYPKYVATVEVSVPVAKEESAKILAETGELVTEKTVPVVEKGVLRRFYIKADQFVLRLEDRETIRQTTIPISTFLKEVRNLLHSNTSGEQLRKYIWSNSVEVINSVQRKPYLVDYASEAQVENFIKINKTEILNNWKHWTRTEDAVVIGRFIIKFPSYTQEIQMLKWLDSEYKSMQEVKTLKEDLG